MNEIVINREGNAGSVKMILIFFLFIVSIQVFAQNSDRKKDSLRTLEMLKEVLNKSLENSSEEESSILDLEIDGLVMDETITKVGRDFYDMFYSGWSAPKSAKNFTIEVKEMILPGLATQVTVMVNEVEVFKQRIQPRYDILEQMSKYAIRKTVKYLENYEKMKAQLDGGDQSGSGIF